MSNNKSLLNAKIHINDNLYTMFGDIDAELTGYNFRNKIVYCNCDTGHSNFVKYFIMKFKSFGLKGLFCTGYYDGNKHGYYCYYDGNVLVEHELNGNGDYRSTECLSIMNKCDIVVTNPPFSLMQDYLLTLLKNDKKFIIIAPENTITYKNIFPYVISNKIWTGNNMVKRFKDAKGNIVKFGNICWLTNVVPNNIIEKTLPYNALYSNEYVFYDNYDAINIDRIKDIPIDYDGVMGVPVSYFKYHNAFDYDIVGISSSSKENAGKYHISNCKTTRPVINGKMLFSRIFIKKKNKLKKVV